MAAAAYTAAKIIAKDRSEKRSTNEPLNAPAIPKRKVDIFPWSNVEKARNGGFSSRDASLNGNGSDGACTVKPFPGTATVADKPVLHAFPGQRVEGSSVKVSEGTNSKGDDKKQIDLPDKEAQLKHIFREGDGHVTDTPENRSRILEVANDPECYIGKDARGNEWYARTECDGFQTWVRVRNGKVDNAGINITPRTWDDVTGLYNNTGKK